MFAAPDVLIVGVGRYGRRLAEQLQGAGRSVLGVDFDPELARRAARGTVPVFYGDAADAGLAEALPLQGARWVAITLPDADDALAIVDTLRRHRFAGRIALAARHQADLRRLSRARPDLLLKPFDAADHAARLLIAELPRAP